MKKNIILIGMPGAGKSTVGVVLAKMIGYHFLDSDLLIQEEEGRLLHQIIKEDGLEGFIKIENRVNSGIEADRTVIATGGSVIYAPEAMKHLSEIGVVVYIKASFKIIKQRVGDLTDRGVAMEKEQTLEDLYNERCPLYEQYAHIEIQTNHTNISEMAAQIVKKVKESN